MSGRFLPHAPSALAEPKSLKGGRLGYRQTPVPSRCPEGRVQLLQTQAGRNASNSLMPPFANPEDQSANTPDTGVGASGREASLLTRLSVGGVGGGPQLPAISR